MRMGIRRAAVRRGAATWLAALAVVAASCDAGKVRLALRLAEGSRYGLTATTEMTIQQTVLGENVVIRQSMTTEHGLTVRSVAADGRTTVDFAYERVAIDLDGPMGTASYDSAAPPAEVPPLLSAYAALVGLGFTVTFAPDLRVDRVDGVDALIEALLGRLPYGEREDRAAVVEILRQEFGDEAVLEGIQRGFAVYPERPVGTGDSWKRATRLRIGVPLIAESTYTLTARDGGAATVAIAGTFRTDPAEPTLTLGGMTLNLDLAGTQAGTSAIDETSGWVTRTELAQEIQGRMTLDSLGGIPAGIDWPLSVQGKTTVRVVARP